MLKLIRLLLCLAPLPVAFAQQAPSLPSHFGQPRISPSRPLPQVGPNPNTQFQIPLGIGDTPRPAMSQINDTSLKLMSAQTEAIKSLSIRVDAVEMRLKKLENPVEKGGK